MTQMAAFPTLLALLENPSVDSRNRESLIELLHWVLIVQDDPGFRTLSKEEVTRFIVVKFYILLSILRCIFIIFTD